MVVEQDSSGSGIGRRPRSPVCPWVPGVSGGWRAAQLGQLALSYFASAHLLTALRFARAEVRNSTILRINNQLITLAKLAWCAPRARGWPALGCGGAAGPIKQPE